VFVWLMVGVMNDNSRVVALFKGFLKSKGLWEAVNKEWLELLYEYE